MKSYHLHHTKRVLVAEEDARLADCLTTYLDDEGFDVVIVTNDKQVSRSIGYDSFDLCVFDYSLPDEILSLILSNSGRIISFTPVILLTGNGTSVKDYNAFCPAPIYMLVKPFTLTDFGSVVRSILGQLSVTKTTRPNRRLHDESFAF